MVHGRRIKLRLAHTGGHQPPIIVIHGKQTEALPETYKRYLMHVYHKALKIVGTPIRLQFKTDSNPYEGKKNVLTPGQQQKRQRMMRHYRK
jgi:GTP-binding protein